MIALTSWRSVPRSRWFRAVRTDVLLPGGWSGSSLMAAFQTLAIPRCGLRCSSNHRPTLESRAVGCLYADAAHRDCGMSVPDWLRRRARVLHQDKGALASEGDWRTVDRSLDSTIRWKKPYWPGLAWPCSAGLADPYKGKRVIPHLYGRLIGRARSCYPSIASDTLLSLSNIMLNY